MVSLSALSRRALVAVVTLAATVPAAEAKKKPQAFVVATVRSAELNSNDTGFEVVVPVEFVHPDSGVSGAQLLGGIAIGLAPSADAARADIIKSIKTNVSITLQQLGVTVPPDRIAVTLL
jgi:hypothetical protein